jgi:hypothetical protein
MRRVIRPLKEFNHALTALDAQLPLHLVRDVACRIAAAPDCASSFQSGEMHILHTRGYDQYPAFSLFYKFDDRTIYLAHIQLRDELEAYEDVEIWE